MTSTPSYDPACETLARHFLGADAEDERVTSLAETLQNAVEEWFSMETMEIPDFSEWMK